MDDQSDDVAFTVFHSTLTPEDLAVVEKALTKAVLDASGQPKDTIEQFMAAQVKLELEYRLKGAWNCIIGEKFGASVNVEENTYGQFYLDEKYNVFVFKNPSLGLGK